VSNRFQTIEYAVEDGIGRLVMNRPQVLNAIDTVMREEMGTAIAEAEYDSKVRVLLITGAGERAFCAGMDLRAFGAQTANKTPLQIRDLRRSMSNPLGNFRKPAIAAINGLAYGGGLELALLCDIVLAAEHATFAAAEVARGLIPGNGATQRLPRKVGLAPAMEMLLTGAPIDAQKALAVGLVNKVVPAARLLAASQEMCTAIGKNGPLAVIAAKEAVRRGIDMPLDQGLGLESDLLTQIHATEDAKEGVLAFIEKRNPVWKGC
jgi:enoyl-CoA hydratase/carnithine racemase